MTDIEKALAMIAPSAFYEINPENVSILVKGFKTAIEQHEAFRQEVSDAVTYIKSLYPTLPIDCERFIIPAPKPDPLVRVINEVIYAQPHGDIDEIRMADDFRAALEARGLEIREKMQ